MRSWVAVTLALLTIVLLAPTANAHLGAVETDAETPLETTFEQSLCMPTCETGSSRLGYAPPATVVTNGSTVTWTLTTDNHHTATSDVPTEDKAEMLATGSAPFGEPCLDAFIADYDPGVATFEIRNGTLQVLHSDDPDATWQPCDEAIALPGGAYALSYHCTVHPRFQHGMIVVLPEA